MDIYNFRYNFRKIEWGPDDAKGDKNLFLYFVQFPEFDQIKKGKYRYIIGRKGTGKTAIIEKIKLEIEEKPLSFYSVLSLRDFPINYLRDLREKSYRDKSQYVPIWLFLIYIELCKLILEDHGAKPSEVIEELKVFLEENGLLDVRGFLDTLSVLKERQSKLKVLSKWLGGEYKKQNQTQSFISMHYQKIVKIIEKLLLKIETKSDFRLFMDELDEGYRAGDKTLRLILLALFRATEDSAINLKHSKFNYKPLLVLRSDIYDYLEDNDLNKLDDYTLRLKWISYRDDSPYSLKNIPIARIRASVRDKLPIDRLDLWNLVVYDNDPNIPSQVGSIWKYIANRTYERPRDVIKFLKYCQEFSKSNGRLTYQVVKHAENKYSEWLFNEIRDELHSYLPVWREALQCLSRIGKGKLTVQEYINEIKKHHSIQRWLKNNDKDPEEILEILFNFSIIGNLDEKGRWLFKYKDHDLIFDPSMNIIVHFGLKKKLRLFDQKKKFSNKPLQRTGGTAGR